MCGPIESASYFREEIFLVSKPIGYVLNNLDLVVDALKNVGVKGIFTVP